MPFVQKKAALILSVDDKKYLEKIRKSRTEEVRHVERAQILLKYSEGLSVPKIAKELKTTVPKVDRCVKKALEFGVRTALDDFTRPGRPDDITPEARAWVVSLACQKPKDLGYSYELWTTRLLAQHIRGNAKSQGHPSVVKIGSGTVSKILSANDIKPHKVTYYLQKRDPEFDRKIVQVLHTYQQVEWIIEDNELKPSYTAIISYDEKPGIQAIALTAPDLPLVPGKHMTISRDHEYVRHGTLSLLAGIDLVTGEIIGSVEERHRSEEFIAFLKKLDAYYEPNLRIQIILDNHSSHTSKKTREYLETVPNRFEFVFTPKHASWLNIIESFFAKMTKSVLRHIRVESKDELKKRLELYMNEVNQNPIPFRWKYGLESANR